MSSIIAAAATLGLFTACTSTDARSWIGGLSVLAVVLLLSIAAGFFINNAAPKTAAVLLHAWTPLVLLLISGAIVGALCLAFGANSTSSVASSAAKDGGAAGILGGFAAVAALVVEASQKVFEDHRTAWLAEARFGWLIGDTADQRLVDNVTLWDRLWGADPAPNRWRFSGLVETLRLAKKVREARHT